MGQDLIGRMFGRYRIDAKIGQGGMGIVFEATDETLKRVVALKVLGDGIVSSAGRKARFMREARLAAAMTHANIATVHDVGETADGHVFIAMELVRGTTLRQRLARGPLRTNEAIRIARDIGRALVKAHAVGIVHRDLKPDNIMVSEELDVKILDFGLAKPIDLQGSDDAQIAPIANAPLAAMATLDGHIVGTPGYMSPEQIAGRPVDVRTDFFAVGALLYEMTTGVRPFTGASVADVLFATTHDEPTRPSTFVPDMPRALERVILRCLEKNADARYADPLELLAALDALRDLRDGTDRASPIASLPLPTTNAKDVGALRTQESFVGPTGSERRRGPRIALFVLAGIALAATSTGVHLFRARPQPTATTSAPSPLATALTDLPLPPSPNPNLLAEYAAGMQALRDDDWGIAESHFAHVVALDPLLAIGHLRLAMAAEGTLDESIRREHFARTVPLRAQLSPRDLAMMEALEPVLQRLHEDRAESSRRLEAMSALYPGDVEVLVWLASLQQTNVKGLAAADRAIALDPRDGQAWQTRGDVLASLGRASDARIAYERCGAISPGSAECFLGLMWLESMEGRCDEAERDARRAVDRDPHLVGNLACVMYGAGRPIEAVREVVEQEASSSSPNAWQTILDQTRLALATGDFVQARALAEKYQAAADADAGSPFRDHLFPALILVGIAHETGTDAFRDAWSFVSRSDTWSKSSQTDSGMDPSLSLARRTVRAGGLSLEGFAARRSAWIDGQRRTIAQPGLIWTYAYASTAETAEEANEALARLPDFAPLSSFVYHVGIPDAEVGAVYLLAGQVDRAIVHLTKAVATCSAFRYPFVHTRATLQLGEALEATGDKAHACDAYAKVVARWGNAKPRSISAEKARAHRSSLGCAP